MGGRAGLRVGPGFGPDRMGRASGRAGVGPGSGPARSGRARVGPSFGTGRAGSTFFKETTLSRLP